MEFSVFVNTRMEFKISQSIYADIFISTSTYLNRNEYLMLLKLIIVRTIGQTDRAHR